MTLSEMYHEKRQSKYVNKWLINHVITQINKLSKKCRRRQLKRSQPMTPLVQDIEDYVFVNVFNTKNIGQIPLGFKQLLYQLHSIIYKITNLPSVKNQLQFVSFKQIKIHCTQNNTNLTSRNIRYQALPNMLHANFFVWFPYQYCGTWKCETLMCPNVERKAG